MYEFQFENSNDRKEIVISNVTCSEQVQILTLFVGILYGENDNNNLSVLKLEISWNKLQFTGIELKGHRI